MTHVEEELARIGARLAAYPDPFEHAGLYAAQQALSWAMQPEAFASPYATVTRQHDTSRGLNIPPLPETADSANNQ